MREPHGEAVQQRTQPGWGVVVGKEGRECQERTERQGAAIRPGDLERLVVTAGDQKSPGHG